MIGKCTDCGKECNVEVIDFGIGSYEYWGTKAVDIRLEAVSDCCEAPAVDTAGHEITVQQVKDNDLPDPENWNS